MSNMKRFVELGKKIVCVARNYGEHIREMTHEIPVQPLIFLKPTSSYVTEGNPIIIPSGCKNLHHEVELGLVIGDSKPAPLGAINNDNYREFIAGYVLALDMTARDFQETAKKAGHPWALAKAFDTSCAVGDFVPADDLDPCSFRLMLEVNDVVRQRGNTLDMIFPPGVVLEHINRYFSLQPGDLILTGTPSGVGQVKAGDVITGSLRDIKDESKVFSTIRFQVRDSEVA